MNKKKYRVAVVMSHLVNYKIDLYKELNRNPSVAVMVYFCSDFGLRKAVDKTAQFTVKWYEQEILNDLPHKFLKNYAFNNDSPLEDPIRGTINPAIFFELRRNHYDAVIIDGYMMLTNWLALIGAWFSKTPILFKGDISLINQRTKWLGKIKKIILPGLLKKMDAFLVYSKMNAEYYEYYGIPKEKLFFAPYAVNNDYFQSKHQELLIKKEELKKKLLINADYPTILFVSKMIERKRPMDLLKAFEIVCENIEGKAQLLLVGDGPERARMQDYTQKKKLKNVYFTGYKNQEELPQYYIVADIFVLPSAMEVWGLVINEAMNFSLPVITTDTTGAGQECVKTGVNGLIYKTGDIEELASQITKLVENKSLRKIMGINSLEIINEWNYKIAVSGILEAIKFTKKKGVIVAQPGSHHIWQAAIGLEKAKLLKYYATSVYYSPNKFPYIFLKLLPGRLKEKIVAHLKRRFHSELNQTKIKTYGFYEWLYIINSHFIGSKKFYYWLIRKRNENFSTRVGILARKKANIVWSGMDAALETFKMAKGNGIKCILDQFLGHPISLNKILKKEIDRQPYLKIVAEGFFTDANLKRLNQEIELADFIVAGSDFVKETLLDNQIPSNKIVVIPYGVDTDLFKPSKNKNKDEKIKMLFVGYISIRKGCHYLLEAVRQLNNPKIELTMIGGMENKYFLERYGAYFKWIPVISHNQLPFYFNENDIYVYPSLFEGSTLSIYEALACGLPIITTPNSGSVVENKKEGFVVPIRDTETIKEKIKLLYNNPALLSNMSLAARKKAEMYTWEIYRGKVVKFIQELEKM